MKNAKTFLDAFLEVVTKTKCKSGKSLDDQKKNNFTIALCKNC